MKALSAILIFGGYMLIYAATANQGKFATEPWAGLFADAYEPFSGGLSTAVGNAGNEIGGAITGVGQRVGSR